MMKAIKFIVKTLLILVVLIVSGLAASYYYHENNKSFWDDKVRALCEKDGGVVVYKKVELTPEEYRKYGGRNGKILLYDERSPDAYKYDYFTRREVTSINKSNPEVRRKRYVVYRKSSGEELGAWVTYSRRGGDMPTGIAHPSSFSCSQLDGFETNIEGQIFSVKGDEI